MPAVGMFLWCENALPQLTPEDMLTACMQVLASMFAGKGCPGNCRARQWKDSWISVASFAMAKEENWNQ